MIFLFPAIAEAPPSPHSYFLPLFANSERFVILDPTEQPQSWKGPPGHRIQQVSHSTCSFSSKGGPLFFVFFVLGILEGLACFFRGERFMWRPSNSPIPNSLPLNGAVRFSSRTNFFPLQNLPLLLKCGVYLKAPRFRERGSCCHA